ncbi:rho GTPase-activating protein REN1 isoform X2 [Argentina anserina]|uniref:rho GTPase-activating protein REN1 isoform X2 n=1 Tax=Argentina anserina TaxID=57926 RepID=UPI00217687C5|nr:rho GTPase-activating protein REN1 isoform X2 [Potentilla anserina]
MTNIIPEAPQGDGQSHPPPPPAGGPDHGPDHPDSHTSRGGNTIYKSGPLFISSKGIGWTSWKKRWFILTRTSLVFFRSDPSAVQKGSEVNLTLGGIDLNNSGSVVVKEDKKLLTVLFPDGRDGRAFTLKAETLKDLHEWKEALENALSQAPCGAHGVGKNGILGNDQTDSKDSTSDQPKEKPPVKSTIIGVPILLALEDVDGAPCFLEKALRFVEEHGVKVEGILRQAADVDDVERRIREYEQGKVEFSPDEDPHVIADCVKYVLRELPSSPVPASCCNALLDSFRKSGNDRGGRINAMRTTICDTFPEPNRCLLQRILLMMQTIASHKAVNRMSCSAVAACMAPLLLRPLLAGDCEIENDFSVGGDNSVQLLQAAAAANHAQAIVITLLEEYDNIFGEGSLSLELYSDTEDDETDSEGATEDDEYYEDDETDSGEYDDDDVEIVSGSCTESDEDDEQLDNKLAQEASKVPDGGDESKTQKKLSSRSLKHVKPEIGVKSNDTKPNLSENNSAELDNESVGVKDDSTETGVVHHSTGHGLPCIQKSSSISNGPDYGARHRSNWGRTGARKNLSMESIGFSVEEEDEQIQRLEITKAELEDRIVEEVQDNVALRANLEKQKKALCERRRALELDVARLQEQLQKERDLGAALEAGLNISKGHVLNLANVDGRIRVELEEMVQVEADCTNLKKKVDDLGVQLNQQREQNYGSSSASDACILPAHSRNHTTKQQTKDKQKDSEAVAPSHFERSRSKDGHQDGTENANEWKMESVVAKPGKKGGK